MKSEPTKKKILQTLIVLLVACVHTQQAPARLSPPRSARSSHTLNTPSSPPVASSMPPLASPLPLPLSVLSAKAIELMLLSSSAKSACNSYRRRGSSCLIISGSQKNTLYYLQEKIPKNAGVQINKFDLRSCRCRRTAFIIQNQNTLQLYDRRFCRNSSLQAVCDTPIARITGCVSSLRI